MDLNDIFIKTILLLLVGSIIFFVVLFYTRSYKDELNGSSLTESEEQMLKDYFTDPVVKDNLDKTYLDKITDIYNKNLSLLMSEINRLNGIINSN